MTRASRIDNELYDILARRVDWGEAVEEIKLLISHVSTPPDEDKIFELIVEHEEEHGHIKFAHTLAHKIAEGL